MAILSRWWGSLSFSGNPSRRRYSEYKPRTGQPGQRCVAILFHPNMNTWTNEADLATASRVSDTPLGQATISINQSPGEAKRVAGDCDWRVMAMDRGELASVNWPMTRQLVYSSSPPCERCMR